MQYLLICCVSIMLVGGQTLWKVGMTHAGAISAGLSLYKKALVIGLNPFIVAGCFVYIVATLLYMYVIGRYAYGLSYALIVALSLLLATGVATLFFNEKINALNIVGIIVILAGVFLVLRR